MDKKRFFNLFFWNFRETTRHFSLRSQNSEYPRIFQVTEANQNARKLLSTDLVNTNYLYVIRWQFDPCQLIRYHLSAFIWKLNLSLDWLMNELIDYLFHWMIVQVKIWLVNGESGLNTKKLDPRTLFAAGSGKRIIIPLGNLLTPCPGGCAAKNPVDTTLRCEDGVSLQNRQSNAMTVLSLVHESFRAGNFRRQPERNDHTG